MIDKDFSHRPLHERDGYVFRDYDAAELASALGRAISCYYEFPEHFRELMKNVMCCDYSRKNPGQDYRHFDEKVLHRCGDEPNRPVARFLPRGGVRPGGTNSTGPKLEVDIAVGETILAKCLGGVGKDRYWQKADSNLLKFYAVTQLRWREKADVELGGELTD